MSHNRSQANILFVCLGNICRSPAGEGIMIKRVADRALQTSVRVDSAGTSAYHRGELPNARMRSAAEKRGYALTSRARQFEERDFEEFDLIIAMDRSNLTDIQALDPIGRYRNKVKLLSEFLDESWPTDVPDPYFGGEAGFDYVLDMLEAACNPLLDTLLSIGEKE